MWVSSAAPKSVSQRTGSAFFVGLGGAGPQDGEPVVLAGDLGPAGSQVLDRVVGTVMAERELVGLQAHRPAEQLMAEADPVHGALAHQLADRLDDTIQRGGITGAVGEGTRLGAAGEQLRRAGR